MQFRKAWFKNERSEMDDETFSIVYSEYIDTSGQFKTEEFDRVSTLHYMNNRRNGVALGVRLQREFIKEFGVPFVDNFNWFKEKGLSLKWNGNIDNFEKQLAKIEDREKKWVTIIEKKVKDLNEYRSKKENKQISTNQSETSFVRMIHQLRKNGWKLDWNDTVEDLAYIVKQQIEEHQNNI